MSLPAAAHGEWASLPLNVLAGIIAGQLRRVAPEQEDIWSFSPFIDLTLYRMIRRNLPRPRVFDWQVTFFATIVGLRFLQTEIWRFWPNSIFSLESPGLWMGGAGGTLNGYLVESAIYLTVVMVVGTELKIFNSVRIQIKLEEQERLLLQARMAALQNQINPHFLFNTLNSISSLVRFDPDTAREMILKLATILRRLLHSADSFVSLREEVEFIDNYLDIEVVRFGRDKLKVVKDLDPASLEAMVPSMLLQPLVENCIKHGLSPKVEGGSITLRSRLIKSRLVVEVEDDGVGMGSAQEFVREHEQADDLGGMGIGMANVAERLKVLYGDAAKMMIESREGGGTVIRLRLPILPNPEELMTTSAIAPAPFGKNLRKAE
jgi:two-component system LytT family sensor kinase